MLCSNILNIVPVICLVRCPGKDLNFYIYLGLISTNCSDKKKNDAYKKEMEPELPFKRHFLLWWISSLVTVSVEGDFSDSPSQLANIRMGNPIFPVQLCGFCENG